VEDLNERDRLEKLNIDRRKLLEWILKMWGISIGFGSSVSK
jgi:hypothetical protein